MPYTRKDEGAKTIVSCEGETLAEVFLSAAHGLFDVLASGNKIRGDTRQEIVVQAENINALFREWLKELMARVALSGMLYSDFEVFSVQNAGPKQVVLTGAVYGEPFDDKRHTVAKDVSLDEKSVACSEKEKAHCSFAIVRS